MIRSRRGVAGTFLLLEKPLAGYLLVSLQIFLAGALDDLRRQLGRRAIFVPAGLFQPVADELLVERRRAGPRTILVDRPEAGAVRGQDLVDQDQIPVRQPAPLELGVGN